ncbi:unnamed protein product [Symbiodinium sp. CCMP2592]|nr:unnamed protein product [Symbiodinium sp. CCMP2592]
MAVPQSIVFEVQTIMDGEMPLNSKTEAVLAVLEHAGLASKQRLLPRHLLIHPDNRSQSMLSVWSKGLAMSMVGFNVKLVEGTTIAFAMSTEPEKRAMQLAKNKALIDNAKGHLAPMTGYLTIGGSHTVAYLRCIENGVTGPSAESSTHPKSDAIWRAISEGWTWVTISSAVEDAIPILPSFLQSSLNSANSIQKSISELEVAMLLATCFGKGMTLAQAVKHAGAADVRCRSSISAIATFVQKFSGHAGTCPILHFLSNFSKVHSSSMLLGEDMMTQIATMDFKSSTNMYPVTRAAIWLTLLACPKNHERDGFARNLIRSDIERLRQAACLPMTTKAEQMLQDAWGIHQSIHEGQGKHIDGHHVDNCFGRLCIRTILHLCNKAKTGSRECREFASLEVIVEAFSTELYKDSPASGAEASKSDEKPMVDVLSAKPHVVALLQNAHMTMGGKYTNSKEHGSMVFILQSVSDDGACMRHTPFFGDSIDIRTSAGHGDSGILHVVHKKHSSTSSLALGQFPSSLMTMVTCKKKAGIKLTPMGNISKHKAEGAPKGTALEAFGSHWVVSPPKQNTLFEDEKHPLVPYFWVRACASDAQPNMSFSTIVQDGVTVPMLYNEEPIEKHEVLLHPPMEETMQEPPKKKTASPGAAWAGIIRHIGADTANHAATIFEQPSASIGNHAATIFEQPSTAISEHIASGTHAGGMVAMDFGSMWGRWHASDEIGGIWRHWLDKQFIAVHPDMGNTPGNDDISIPSHSTSSRLWQYDPNVDRQHRAKPSFAASPCASITGDHDTRSATTTGFAIPIGRSIIGSWTIGRSLIGITIGRSIIGISIGPGIIGTHAGGRGGANIAFVMATFIIHCHETMGEMSRPKFKTWLRMQLMAVHPDVADHGNSPSIISARQMRAFIGMVIRDMGVY